MTNEAKIVMYKSSFCGHSSAVEKWLQKHSVAVEFINIDEDPAAREQVMALNNGYASVPTLLFPDGTQLTEPSFGQLRAQLGIESDDVVERVKRLFLGKS